MLTPETVKEPVKEDRASITFLKVSLAVSREPKRFCALGDRVAFADTLFMETPLDLGSGLYNISCEGRCAQGWSSLSRERPHAPTYAPLAAARVAITTLLLLIG